MARTDKTRPWHVKAADKPAYLVPEHDHRFGPCDLPARPAPGKADLHRPAEGGRCFWTASRTFWSSKAARCGCPMCSGTFDRRVERRRARRTAKQALRDPDTH